MPNILVTGGAGFIGYFLLKELSADPANTVYCVDSFVRGEDDVLYNAVCDRPNVTRIVADLSNKAEVDALPDDINLVYHLAALNGTQNFYERPFDVLKYCTLPTVYLLEKYASAGLDRFVFAGTSEAYASTVTQFGWEVPTAEDVPLSISSPDNVRWSYGGSKIHGEIAIHCAAHQMGVPFSIIRYHNVYGPRMGDKHVVPDFLIRAKNNVFELYGYEDTRAFMYIDDAVAATIKVATTPECRNETVNIGSEKEVKILDLAERMMKLAELDGEIELHPSPAGSVRRRAPNTDKLRALTGFQETWDLDAGLLKTIDFYLNGNIEAGK
jgi:nucleoside-diphosphate-sugar epimerase